MFGALKEVANPTRCAQVAVVEVLAQNREDIEPDTGLRRGPQDALHPVPRSLGVLQDGEVGGVRRLAIGDGAFEEGSV